MMLTNIYRTPVTSVTLKPEINDMASCNTLTAGKDYYVSFWVTISSPRHSENILWQRDHVHAERAVYRPVLSIDKHVENSNDSRVWLSNSPSDRLRGLRELRVRETSVGLPGHNTLQRGYDAARLTLTGVMA